MIKSLKRFLIKIARFFIGSILLLEKTYNRRGDKNHNETESIQETLNGKKVEGIEVLKNSNQDKPLKLPPAMRAGLRAKVADRMKQGPEFRKRILVDVLAKKQQHNEPQYLSIDKREETMRTAQQMTDQPVSWKEIDKQIDRSFKNHNRNNPKCDFKSFDWTKLTKSELDTLYHQIIDKALENYEYRLHVLFKWKINYEEFHHRAARSLAIRIRREEQRMKKHDIIGAYFKKRWDNLTPEEVEANRKWIIEQGKHRNPN